MEDAELVREAQDGSSQAFGQLVRRHEAHVGAVVIARMRQTSHVDDVVQETFVAAWVQRNSLREPAKFRSWVCGIARNQASKARRSTVRTAPGVGEGTGESVGESVEQALLKAESRQALLDSLASLPEAEREVLVLFYREEQSIREIAHALDLSEAAAQKRISRARKAIKERVCARLADELPRTRAATSASAAVLATIATGLGTGVANASSTAVLSKTLAKGSLSMKFVASMTTLAAIGGGIAVYTYANANEKQESPEPAAVVGITATKAVAALPSEVVPPTETASTIALGRITKAEREARFAEREARKSEVTTNADGQEETTAQEEIAAQERTSPPGIGMSQKEVITSTIKAVRPLIAECHDLATLSAPDLFGKVVVRFHISNEPDIRGLVTETEIKSRFGGFSPPNEGFEECLRETLMSLEFQGIGQELSVAYPFVFRDATHEEVPERLSMYELHEAIDEATDAEELVELANEFIGKRPGQSLRACDKAIDIDASASNSYQCALNACRANQRDRALGYWAMASEFSLSTARASQARKLCSEHDIVLP